MVEEVTLAVGSPGYTMTCGLTEAGGVGSAAMTMGDTPILTVAITAAAMVDVERVRPQRPRQVSIP